MKTTNALNWLIVGVLLVVAGLACNAPTAGGGNGSPTVPAVGNLDTAIAGTSSAAMTETVAAGGGSVATVSPATTVAPVASPEGPTPVKPSDTPGPTNTPGTSGCTNSAAFVSDVTIPDDTVVQPGQTFVKTWRLNNNGTCAWQTTYQLAFVSGAQMGAPAAVTLPGVVNAGSNMDVSVTFTAPLTPGTYTSQWQMRTGAGELFGTKPYVRIIVPAPTSTATATTPATATAPASETPTVTPTVTPSATGGLILLVTLTPSATATSGGVLGPAIAQDTFSKVAPSGQVSGAGEVTTNVNNVGDLNNNAGLQGLVTFNLSSIPVGSTITDVRLTMGPYDQLGTPFTDLGCLRVYAYNFGPSIEASDFFSGGASGALWRFCSTTDLDSETAQMIGSLDAIQAAVGGLFQLRFQFNEKFSNNDNGEDVLRPTPKLVITYQLP